MSGNSNEKKPHGWLFKNFIGGLFFFRTFPKHRIGRTKRYTPCSQRQSKKNNAIITQNFLKESLKIKRGVFIMKSNMKSIKKAFVAILVMQLVIITVSCKGEKVSEKEIMAVIEETMKYEGIRPSSVVEDYWRAREAAADYAETAEYNLKHEPSKEQMRTMLDTLNMNLAKLEKEYNDLDDNIKKKVRPDLF